MKTTRVPVFNLIVFLIFLPCVFSSVTAQERDISDEDINLAVYREILADDAVDSHLLEITTTDGVVTLSGTVGHILARDRAVSIAQSVRGVKDALFYDPRISPSKVKVDVEKGTAVLSGKVDHLRAKRLAEQAAENTVGVNWVKNYIRVMPDVLRSDAEVAEDVREALREDPAINRFELSVMVNNNKVYLYGFVDSPFEKKQAEMTAERVDGVADVKNNLRLEYVWERKMDWQIEWDITKQISWNPYFEDDTIKVAVLNGVAELTGRVDSWFEYSEATQEAFEGGAREVVNKLKVENKT